MRLGPWENRQSRRQRSALLLGITTIPQDFVGHVVSAVRAQNAGIVLMHEIHPNTLKKLDKIIAALLVDGFVFAEIDDPDFQSSLRWL